MKILIDIEDGFINLQHQREPIKIEEVKLILESASFIVNSIEEVEDDI